MEREESRQPIQEATEMGAVTKQKVSKETRLVPAIKKKKCMKNNQIITQQLKVIADDYQK